MTTNITTLLWTLLSVVILTGCAAPTPPGAAFARAKHQEVFSRHVPDTAVHHIDPGHPPALHPASADPMDPAVLRDRWGFLSTLAGKTYVNQRDGRTTIAQWRWEVPGLVLNERRYYPLPEKSYGIPIPQVFRYDVASQQLVMRGMFGYIQSDGSIVAVTDLALSPDDHFVPLADGYSVIEEKRGRGAPKVFRPFDPSRLEEYLAYDHEARRMRQAEREAFWNSVGQGLAAASQAYADTRPGSKAGAANPAGKANAGPAGTSSLPTLTAQFSYQCAYGSRIDVAIPYKTPACLAVKKEFTKTFACNDVDRMAGAAAACQQACGNRACDER